MAYRTKIWGSQHVPFISKFHWDSAGMHLPSRKTALIASSTLHSPAMNHIIMVWQRPGFMMRVKTATTASFGIPNDRIPNGKPTSVQKVTLSCCA